MTDISGQQLQNLRSEFWKSKNHLYLEPASLIADKTSSALFTIAGMQQLIPYLAGADHPLGKRLYNIQGCIRTVDLDEVGDDSHLTSFFMMGNRSLGDYFKSDAVNRSWEFLTQVLKLDPQKLAVTVYQGDNDVPADEETATYRKQQGITVDKISYLSAKDNRRSPGPVGPCGPCTEIYYRVGETEYPTSTDNVKNNEHNRLEVWNNVFMEYYRNEDGSLTKLKKQNVDTGMGFERILKVLQNKKSPYETDLFRPLIEIFIKYSGASYTQHTTQLRIIVDHIRTVVFLLSQGLIPSNEGRGYVLRRMMRSLYFQAREIFDQTASFQDILAAIKSSIDQIITLYKEMLPSLNHQDTSKLCAIISKELSQFAKTLAQGTKILQKYFGELGQDKTLSGDKVFLLHDTFGFPLELTETIAARHHIAVDKIGFDKAMQIAQEKSRNNTSDIITQKIDRSQYITDLPSTQFIGYESLETESTLLKTISFDDYDVMIFDKTPFYATRGGQINDRGSIIDSGQHYKVFDVQEYNGIILHFVKDEY